MPAVHFFRFFLPFTQEGAYKRAAAAEKHHTAEEPAGKRRGCHPGKRSPDHRPEKPEDEGDEKAKWRQAPHTQADKR